MRIHFGTDGIRGRANENLTNRMAFRIGQFLGHSYSKERKANIIVGRDTRLSSGMFEVAISSGITTTGGNAFILGVCSTPELVYLTREGNFDCGVMITASHNPYTDNGIKIISSSGTKMNSEFELEIENYIYGNDEIEDVIGKDIGEIIDYSEGKEKYLSNLEKTFPIDLTGYKVLLDCANGSSTVTAEEMLKRLNVEVDVINNNPDGLNINKNCGSTHPEQLIELMKQGNYDAGFAYDGDADRVIAIATDGSIVDGDKIIYCCGKYLKEKGLLRNGKVVATVMANLGFFKVLEKEDIGFESTQVGDKYVYECMMKNDYVLGGEQSGHIIFKDLETTGDGLLTSLYLLKVMKETNSSLNQLTDALYVYPQILVNVEVNNKELALNDEDLLNECKNVEKELEGNGRVLVRPSGTEPLVRVMVEATSDELCKKYAYQIADLIKAKNL